MPRIYRTMHADGDKPKVGNLSKMLGVRTEGDHIDIEPDDQDKVHPQSGGMSVSPHWRMMPHHLIPARLKDKFPQARGNNKLFIWRMGEGEFADGHLTGDLFLRVDPSNPNRHGFVEPNKEMSLSDYQSALAATQDQWTVDEV